MQSFTKNSETAMGSEFSIPDPTSTTLRYMWAPRSEVVFLQAILDAYEGLARVRTERHDNNRSLLMFMIPTSRLTEFDDFLRHFKEEIFGFLESI